MNILSVMVVFVGNNPNAKPHDIPDWLGFTIIGVLSVGIIIGLVCEILFPPKYSPILKRTKNPYRRYKRVGWKRNY